MKRTTKGAMPRSIDWKKIELVYEDDGRKVPAMLAKLTGPLAQARDAYSFFATELVHQDAPSPGAVVVAPLLPPFAQDPTCKVAGSLLRLLGTLACGGDPLVLLSMEPRAVDRAFLDAAEACRATALSLLTSRDEQTRLGSAFLLATLDDDVDSLCAAFRAASRREKSPVVRATLLVGLSIFTRGGRTSDRTAFERALAAKAPIERLAGLIGLARSGPLPEKVTKVARGLLAAENVKTFPWRQGNITLLTIDMLRFAAVRDGELGALLALLDSQRAHVIIPAVAPALFPAAVKVSSLDTAQRAFLDLVTRDASNFRLVQDLLVERGLPKKATELRRALGLPGDEPLDVAHRFEGKQRTFRELIELAAKAPGKRAAIARALTAGKTGDEVMGFVVQLVRAQVRGQDPDGALAQDRVASALLAACTDERGLLKQLRDFDFYSEVQAPSGAIFLVEGLRAPIALELARRTKSGDEKRFNKLTASAFDNKWAAPTWREVLLALDVKRRTKYLRDALFDWTNDFFRHEGAFVPVLLATPSESLAREMRYRVKKWQERYAQERKGNGSHFCTKKLDAKKLETLPPREHPDIDRLVAPTRAYANVLRGAKLGKAGDALEKDLEKFLSM